MAGNCGDLGEYGVGVADMATVVDLMDKAFFEMVNNGEKVLDGDFMMDISKTFKEKLPPFKNILITCLKIDKNVLWDQAVKRTEYFLGTCLKLNCFIPHGVILFSHKMIVWS